MPKSWYPRTDRKEYESQLSQIERRQARLSSIRARLGSDCLKSEKQLRQRLEVQATLDSGLLEVDRHYSIGANRNCPVALDDLIDRSGWGVRDPYLVVRHYAFLSLLLTQRGIPVIAFRRET